MLHLQQFPVGWALPTFSKSFDDGALWAMPTLQFVAVRAGLADPSVPCEGFDGKTRPYPMLDLI